MSKSSSDNLRKKSEFNHSKIAIIFQGIGCIGSIESPESEDFVLAFNDGGFGHSTTRGENSHFSARRLYFAMCPHHGVSKLFRFDRSRIGSSDSTHKLVPKSFDRTGSSQLLTSGRAYIHACR